MKEKDLLYHPMHLLSPFPHFLSIPQHSELTLQVRGYDRGILHISVNPYLEVLLFWGVLFFYYFVLLLVCLCIQNNQGVHCYKSTLKQRKKTKLVYNGTALYNTKTSV